MPCKSKLIALKILMPTDYRCQPAPKYHLNRCNDSNDITNLSQSSSSSISSKSETREIRCHNNAPCSTRSPSCSSVNSSSSVSTPTCTPLPCNGSNDSDNKSLQNNAIICPYDGVTQNVKKNCQDQTLGKLTYLELKNLINDVVQSNMTNCLNQSDNFHHEVTNNCESSAIPDPNLPVYDINGNLISAPINQMLEYSQCNSMIQTPINNINTIGIDGYGQTYPSDTIQYVPQMNQTSVLPTTMQTPANMIHGAEAAIVNLSSHDLVGTTNFQSNNGSIGGLNLTNFHNVYNEPCSMQNYQIYNLENMNTEISHGNYNYDNHQVIYDCPMNFDCSQDTVVCKQKLDSTYGNTPEKVCPRKLSLSSSRSSKKVVNCAQVGQSIKTTGRYDFVRRTPSDFSSSTCSTSRTSSKNNNIMSRIKAKARSMISTASSTITESSSSSASEGIRYNL